MTGPAPRRRGWRRPPAATPALALPPFALPATALLAALLAAGPAAAQVLDELAAELTGWQAVFDASFVPIAISAGLLLALVVFCFSRFAGAAVAFFVLVGAFLYGARDIVQGFAA